MESAGVDEMGVLAAQLLGFVVHGIHKGLHAAADGFSQHVAGLIGGDHQHAGEVLFYRHDFAFLDVGRTAVLRQTGGHGRMGSGQLIGQGQLSLVDGLHHQQGGHDLGGTGRIHLLVFVFGIHDVSGFRIHQ